MHLGDVRKVKAVAHPKLIEAGLVNVVIFPTKGARDLANQCVVQPFQTIVTLLILMWFSGSPVEIVRPFLPFFQFRTSWR